MSVTLTLPAPVAARAGGTAEPRPSGDEAAATLGLWTRLAAGLESSAVRYCQWKGSRGTRWRIGEGDVDLLVDRTDAGMLDGLLPWLGFKPVRPVAAADVPGALHYIGHDEPSGRLVHLHVHYDVALGTLGPVWYRLPLAAALLSSARDSDVFRVPEPAAELVLLTLGLVVRSRARDLLRRAEPSWLRTRRPALDALRREVDATRVAQWLAEHLPEIDEDRFTRCSDALHPRRSAADRLAAHRAVARRLGAYVARLPSGPWWRPLVHRLRARGRPPVHLPVAGGALVALVGADGAGKSTQAAALVGWLGRTFVTRHAHLGHPRRSLLTLIVGAARALARRLGPRSVAAQLELLRYLCTARDRYLQYRRVRRAAARGALVVCERYPVPEQHALAGPSAVQGAATAARGRVADWARRCEASYYARIARPDVLCVLRVDPELAVRRKYDEPADYVRQRARSAWQTDWSAVDACVVDAGDDAVTVRAALQRAVWERL